MKPQTTNHLDTARRHFQLATELTLHPPSTISPAPDGWVITCLFYSAVHYVTAYFLETRGNRPTSHIERRSLMERLSHLDPIMDAYNELFDWSQTARYQALPRLETMVQPAFDDLNLVSSEIARLLENA